MRSFGWLVFISLWVSLTLLSDAQGATHSLSLKYQPTKDFPSLREKIGPNLGLAPFKDERKETLYVGYHIPLLGSVSYFKCDPFPLERAIQESLLGPLFQSGIKTTPISAWDGKPDSLKDLETDSVLMIEIKQFWMEGSGALFRTSTRTSVHLVIHLGVKREGKVFSKNVEVKREATWFRLTPLRVEKTFNEIFAEIFDSFFSSPY